MLELFYPFRYCRLYCRYVMFQKRFLSKRKWGGTNSRLGGMGSPITRSDGTGKNCGFVLYFYTRTIKALFPTILVFPSIFVQV